MHMASIFEPFRFEQEPPAIKFVHRVVMLLVTIYVFAKEVSNKAGDNGRITTWHGN